MVTGVWLCTGEVVTVKVVLVSPAGTVTAAGTCATFELLLERATDAPPFGAIPLNVTLPLDFCPPVSWAGVKLSDRTAGGFTVSVICLTESPLDAVNTTWVATETADVVTVNFATFASSGTVIVEGTCATEGLFELRFTTTPPLYAV